MNSDYNSDAILEPNKGVSYCYPLPRLSVNVNPALLEFKIARPEITFAEERGD